MIQFLLFLSYYQIELRRNSPIYLQIFPSLEFGFKKNANYYFNFTHLTTDLVFGLATKSELKKLITHNDDVRYCTDASSLTSIHYSIFNDTQINGQIHSKSVLTPYIFCCNDTSSFTLSLEFLNGHTHLDYRCIYAIIYTLIFGFTFFSIFLFFRIYLRCYAKQENIFYYILIDLFFVFFIKDLMQSFIIFISEKNEFFNQQITRAPFGYLPSFVLSIIEILSYVLVVSELLIVILINFAFNQKNPTGFCPTRVYVIFQTMNFVIICCLQHFEASWMTYFASLVLYIIFSFLLLGIQSTFSVTKLGIMVVLLGNCFTFTLRNMILKETVDAFATQTVFVWLNLISLFTQIISAVLLLAGFFVFNELQTYENEEDIHDSNFDILLDA